MMKTITLNTTDQGTLNIFKFAILQKITTEFYVAVEQPLLEQFDLELSTQYSARFNVNAKTRKKLEKEMKDNTKVFKARSKSYRDKNYKIYNHLASFRSTENEAIESAVEQIYDFIDELIIPSS